MVFNLFNCWRNRLQKKAVREHCPSSVDGDIVDYLAEILVSLLEDDAAEEDSVREDFAGTAGPREIYRNYIATNRNGMFLRD